MNDERTDLFCHSTHKLKQCEQTPKAVNSSPTFYDKTKPCGGCPVHCKNR